MRNWTYLFTLILALSFVSFSCKTKKVPKKRPKPPRVVKKRPKPPRLPRGVKVHENEALIKAGTFTMGSDDDGTVDEKLENPAHKVTLRYVFAMRKKEVTQKEFTKIMGYNPSYFKSCGSNCPVESVSWHEAAYFLNELSRREGLSTCFTCMGQNKHKKHAICKIHPNFLGKRYYQCNGYRFPTEAEWEYAARAGSDGAYYDIPPELKKKAIQKGKLVSTLDLISWYKNNSQVKYKGGFSCPDTPTSSNNRCGPHPVGLKIPNNFGLYDMLGNVSEWTYDRFGKYPAKAVDPTGPIMGRRVFRGGNWFISHTHARSRRRFRASGALRSKLIGIRPVRTLVLASAK